MTDYVGPIHIIVRYGNDLITKNIDTVKEHNIIAKEYGFVIFGKQGRSMGKGMIDKFNKQIMANVDTYLYISCKEKYSYVIHRAQIINVSKTLDKKSQKFVPKYYRNLLVLEEERFKLWFKIKGFRTAQDADTSQLVVASSRYSIYDSLANSMAPFFIIQKEDDE